MPTSHVRTVISKNVIYYNKPIGASLIASNTAIDLIEPLGSTYLSTWNEPDVITDAAARWDLFGVSAEQ